MVNLGRTAAVLACMVLALGVVPSAQASDNDLDDLFDAGQVLGPLDGVIGLLPPVPYEYRPSTSDSCAHGDLACVDEVIEVMEQRFDALAAACDHDAVFALAYLRVTESVRDRLYAGEYNDSAWLAHQDVVFAEDYFNSYDAWHDGRAEEVPQAWRIALRAAEDRSVTAIGNFMLAMNAHINRDFPYVLAEVGLVAPDGTSHKADHDRFNAGLDALYRPVFNEIADRLDPQFNNIQLGAVDAIVVGTIMRGWREAVWRHAEALAAARTPLARSIVEAQIETYAAVQAELYRTVFATGPEARANRDAHCQIRQILGN